MHGDEVGGQGLQFSQHGGGDVGWDLHRHLFTADLRDVSEFVADHGAWSGFPCHTHASFGFIKHH